MAMLFPKLSFALLYSLLFLRSTFSSYPPKLSLSPSPKPISSPLSRTISVSNHSPMAPSSPTSPLSQSPSNSSSPASSPVPSTDTDGDVDHKTSSNLDPEELPRGMSVGQKAGVAFGVIAGACVVILGGVLYKKRQNNIRRSRFGALVWGSSAKHKPQRVGKEHELEDEDVVQIIKKV